MFSQHNFVTFLLSSFKSAEITLIMNTCTEVKLISLQTFSEPINNIKENVMKGY